MFDGCLPEFLHGLQENAIKKKRAEKKSSDEIRLRQEKVIMTIYSYILIFTLVGTLFMGTENASLCSQSELVNTIHMHVSIANS